MSAEKHATVLKAIAVVAILSGFVIFIVTGGQPTVSMFFVSFALFALLWIMVLYLAPVRCHKPGCNGWMRRTWVKAPNSESRLRYVCAICGVDSPASSLRSSPCSTRRVSSQLTLYS